MHSFRKNTAEEFTIMLQSFLLFLFCNYYLEIFFMIFECFVDLTKRLPPNLQDFSYAIEIK